MIADVNDKKVSEAAERDEELKKMRIEVLNMAQDKEVQNMLIQEKYDRMDILTYGNDKRREGMAIGEARGEARGEKKGDRQRMEEDARGMYAEGIKPDVIARIQKVSVDVIERILGLQPV